MNDYYQILDLKHRFSSFNLLRNYFKRIKHQLEYNETEELIKTRMGFEVLRDEECKVSYNRIHRKYILNEELNFPKSKETEMINLFQAKEQLGKQEANKVITNKDSFRMLIFKCIIMFVLIDISYSFFGGSGILYIVCGMCLLLISSIHAPMIVGMLFILLGLGFLSSSFDDFVRSYY